MKHKPRILLLIVIFLISYTSAQMPLRELEFENKTLCNLNQEGTNVTSFTINPLDGNKNLTSIDNLILETSSNISFIVAHNVKKDIFQFHITNFTEENLNQITFLATGVQKAIKISQNYTYEIKNCITKEEKVFNIISFAENIWNDSENRIILIISSFWIFVLLIVTIKIWIDFKK